MTPPKTQTGTCTLDGCSRPQRSRHLCDRHYAQMHNKEVKRTYTLEGLQRKRSSLKGRFRYLASNAVQNAIYHGILHRKSCEECGDMEADAHHDSYFKDQWLIVRWLCRKHHAAWHLENKPLYPDTLPLSDNEAK